MNWEQLLSLKRYGDTNKRLRKEQDETRLGFDVDYDRVVFSTEFRSLQDKTQVIPLSDTDFVHTRLTHSLEVSSVAKSIGRRVGQALLKKYPHLENVHGYQSNDFGAIVAAAALAHDIGNPPFGHSGEKSIGEFYKTGEGLKFKTVLTNEQYQDLIDFEGNAHGFKILTEGEGTKSGGLRLSYATLGAFMKYPKESLPKKPSSHIADKKYGVFQSEVAAFEDIASDLGLIKRGEQNNMSYSRHPLAYLVEAADDICYTIIDFEDGINLGLIDEDYALEFLIKLVRDSIIIDKYRSLTNTKDRVSYLRALAINVLVNEAVHLFMTHEEEILKGNFSKALMDVSKYDAQIKDIIKISIEKVYQSTEVLDKEIVGYKVIHQLLNVYTQVVVNMKNDCLSNYDKLIMKVLPADLIKETADVYTNLMAVSGYVAKMSDRFAILTYRKLKGSNL